MNPKGGERILGVDPGEKRVGIAVGDVEGNLLKPLKVINHESRASDANQIILIAQEQKAELILIGAALGSDGEETPASRKADRLAEEIRSRTELPVILWDESGSTKEAQELKRTLGVSKKKRAGHQDATAAAILIEDYVESVTYRENEGEFESS
jgi:putative holliday junction resolvase